MSVELDHTRRSLSSSGNNHNIVVAPQDRTPSISSLPPLLSPGPRLSACAPTSPTRTRTSLATSGVPLERYREKLEECAALHNHVAALTRSNAACEQALIEERAETARLRALVAELQEKGTNDSRDEGNGVSEIRARNSLPRRHSHPFKEKEVQKDEERGEEGYSAAATPPSASPEVPAMRAADGGSGRQHVGEEGHRRQLKATATMMAADKRTRQARGDTRSGMRCDCVEAAPPQTPTPAPPSAAPHSTADAVKPSATRGGDRRHSNLSSSSSSSSSLSTCSQDSADTEGTKCALAAAAAPRPWYSARLSAAESTAYVQAMCELAGSPLGPWEE